METKTKRRLLSVIVPAYKQERTIKQDLKSIDKTLSSGLKDVDYEIICVIDGALDNTEAEAKKVASSNIFVYSYPDNAGKGYAVRFGMSKAKGDLISFLDAGMDISPRGIMMLMAHLDWYNADIIVGSKRHPVSKVEYPWQRRILSIVGQLIVWFLFGLNVKDTQVGMKFFKKEVLEKVLPRLLVKRFAFDIEMLVVANYLGFNRIFEAPVDINLKFGVSTLTSEKFIRTVFATLVDTLAVYYRLNVLKYYSDENKRKWVFDPELRFRVNIG